MMTVGVDRFVIREGLMPNPRGLLYLSPPGEPNRERCGVVSAPRVSLCGLEPDYGIGGSTWRLQALKMRNTVEISTYFAAGKFPEMRPRHWPYSPYLWACRSVDRRVDGSTGTTISYEDKELKSSEHMVDVNG